jgi:hypothetical protein
VILGSTHVTVDWEQQLRASLRLSLEPGHDPTGPVAFVWLVDVAGLPREEAAAMLRWSARAMLRSALSDGFPPP